MTAKIMTTFNLDKELFQQTELLAEQHSLSQNELFEQAIQYFIENNLGLVSLDEETEMLRPLGDKRLGADKGRTGINQGEIYWIPVAAPPGASTSITHPHVVIQNDILNHSRIDSTVVCALTTNLKRASAPGNVLLEAGEANLPRQSVVEVSKLSIVDKGEIGEYIGSLSERRLGQILAGMEFLHKTARR